MPPSPIELLLPKGFARGAIVLGSACPSVLAPVSSRTTTDEDPVDLVVLAPSRDERRDRRWIDRSAGIAAARLSPDGIAYVVPAGAARLRRALSARGLYAAGTLLHLPDVARSNHVVPVGTEAERYALSGRLGMKRLKRRAASVALRALWTAWLAPTGAMLRRDPAAPLAEWLFRLTDGPAEPGSVLLTTRPTGGSVLHRFADRDREPNAVAKVSTRTTDEEQALLELAPAAGRCRARVPAVLWSGELGDGHVLVQTALRGQNAARLVEQRHLDPAELQERIAVFLERWSRSAARPGTLSEDDLERLVLSPAASLAGGHGRYLEHLEELCTRALGSSCAFVPVHADLTAANIVVDDADDLGILDWEAASSEGLPLTDFFYAAADVVAAARGYTDRPGAVVSCFAVEGQRAPHVRRLVERLADALALTTVVQEVCFHACWLHHAANEAARTSDLRPGPFETILMTVAGNPARFDRSYGREPRMSA